MLYYFLFLIYFNFANASNKTCPELKLQTDPRLNISEYVKSSWYIQQQQVNGYQSLDELYCVIATYTVDNHSHVPFFDGKVLSVYNYATQGSVNGTILSNSSAYLCARVKNLTEPEKLLVAPCFLPNLFGGPYWIVSAGPRTYHYEWAIISGGQPNVRRSNYTCTTSETGVLNSGLWLFTRSRLYDHQTVSAMRDILVSKNVSLDLLHNVTHKGCTYEDAFIKY